MNKSRTNGEAHMYVFNMTFVGACECDYIPFQSRSDVSYAEKKHWVVDCCKFKMKPVKNRNEFATKEKICKNI